MKEYNFETRCEKCGLESTDKHVEKLNRWVIERFSSHWRQEEKKN